MVYLDNKHGNVTICMQYIWPIKIARLGQLKAQNDEVLQQELVQRATLAEIEARLSQTARFNEAELRSQALIRAAEERKNRLATLEERIKSYEAPS